MVQEEEVAGTAYLAGQVVSHYDRAHLRAMPCVRNARYPCTSALPKSRRALRSMPACPNATVGFCVEAPVTIRRSGLLAAIEQSLKMFMLQGPPIEDDEEDYDEEEPPLSEDIEDEEDVDDEAGPSSAAGSRAGEAPLL